MEMKSQNCLLIKETIEVIIKSKIAGIRQISNGHSFNNLYFVSSEDGNSYLVKARTNHSFREEYLLCAHLAKQCASVQIPVGFVDGESGLIIYRWVEGETIKFSKMDSDVKSIKLGAKVAEAIKEMHSCQIKPEMKRPSIDIEVEYYITVLYKMAIEFPYMKLILPQMGKDSREASRVKRIAYTHMDIHSCNLIYSTSHKNVVLIDCENLAITDPWRDFTYALLFHEPEENLFWYSVMLYYFDGTFPDEFFLLSRLYCSVQYLRILLHEYKRSCESARIFGEKAGITLFQTFYSNGLNKPHWLSKYDRYSDTIFRLGD